MSDFYSILEYTATAGQTDFPVTFDAGYIKKSDVSLLVDGVSTPFTWVSDGLITTAPLVGGERVVVQRNTDIDDIIHNYTDGSTLIEKNLDESFKQTVLAAQEALDVSGSSITFDVADGKFNADNRNIKNVADPVDVQDAATKGWVDATYTTAVADAEAARDAAQTAQGLSEDARDTSIAAKTASETARDFANDWATEAEDVLVNDGVNPADYSAFHYKEKARQIQETIDPPTILRKDNDTGAALMPTGTTAQRPSTDPAGAYAYIRYNAEFGQWEGSPDGVTWAGLGGATGGAGNPAFYENDITITADYTITANKNAMTAGPVTIADGVTVTVPDGSTWSIV